MASGRSSLRALGSEGFRWFRALRHSGFCALGHEGRMVLQICTFRDLGFLSF